MNQDNKHNPESKDPKSSKSGFSPRSLLIGLETQDVKRFYFLAVLLLIFLLVWFFRDQILVYASSFLGAITLFAVLRGPMRRLTLKYRWRSSWAAGFLTLIAIFVFLIPISGIVLMLVDLFSKTSFDFSELWEQARRFNGALNDRFGIDLLSVEMVEKLSGFGQTALSWFFSNLSVMAINSVLMIFLLFYMLLERGAFEAAVRDLLPFTQENKNILIEESKRIIVANAISIPVLALIQGFFAYFGYVFLGVTNPLFVAVLTAFSTIIPLVGTMIIFVPVALLFAIEQNWANAIVMLLYGLVVIGGVDNVARFLLQKWIADIHPLITVFGVLFGMSIFGFWGIIFGPLLLSLLILFINMYRHDYVPGSLARSRVTTSISKKKHLRRMKRTKKSASSADTPSV